jgi:hypothetical protein
MISGLNVVLDFRIFAKLIRGLGDKWPKCGVRF